MRLILIRHAESLGQEPGADLSPDGHAQAQALIARLRQLGVGEVFSSPYRRAVATVAPFAAAAEASIQCVEDLRERKLAAGLLPDFLVHMERSFERADYCLPEGESMAMTAQRGLRGLAEVARRARTSCPAAASHGNLIAAVLRTMDTSFGFEAWRSMRNPHIFELEMAGARPASFRSVDVNVEKGG